MEAEDRKILVGVVARDADEAPHARQAIPLTEMPIEPLDNRHEQLVLILGMRQQEVRIDAILARLKEAETEPEQMELEGISEALHSGMNLSQRVQILRLARQGKDAAAVSATLGIPQAEVELLLRVQDLSAKSATAR